MHTQNVQISQIQDGPHMHKSQKSAKPKYSNFWLAYNQRSNTFLGCKVGWQTSHLETERK